MAAKRELGKLYKKGEKIFRQGDTANCMYVIQKGRVEIFLESAETNHTFITLKKGDIFGEVSLFAGKNRFATARATKDARILKLDEKTFVAKLHQDPSLAFGIIRKMAQRIYDQDHEIMRGLHDMGEPCQFTGFASYIDLAMMLESEVSRATQLYQSLAFAIIDVDDYKATKEKYGESAGEGILQVLGDILREHLRRSDVIARYGDDRFGVLLYEADGTAASRVMENVRRAFAAYSHGEGEARFKATFGCGIAIFPEHLKASKLGQAAYKALIRSKEEGKNRVILADPGLKNADEPKGKAREDDHTIQRRHRKFSIFRKKNAGV
ncbi:MAG: GGDEF domain-containing protein [Magnetococcales bacterium]|nr:GGDEF domain-containing protein [Magnetococcales bacterium]